MNQFIYHIITEADSIVTKYIHLFAPYNLSTEFKRKYCVRFLLFTDNDRIIQNSINTQKRKNEKIKKETHYLNIQKRKFSHYINKREKLKISAPPATTYFQNRSFHSS